MLILTRSIGQKIFICDGLIKITVCGVKGNQIRLGIEAPKNISVHREEIFEEIQLNGFNPKHMEKAK